MSIKRTCGVKDDTITTKKMLLKYFRENKVKVVDDGRTIYIGVVFHICFKNYNVSEIEADVNYTIDMLNKDFNKQNSNFDYGKNIYTDPILKDTYLKYINLASNSNIVFYKAQIKYVPLEPQTSSNISILDKNIKGASPAVEPNRYLNLWIVDLSTDLLGYAQFPWEFPSSPSTDGVVIAKGTFGRKPIYQEFNLNKTATHEIGHWLGLYHTFQQTFDYKGGNIDYLNGTGTPEQEAEEMKGDCVADTPPQIEPTYGNPFSNPNTWPKSKPFDEMKSYYHMFMNFMDYSDDIALFMFTKDQIIKIRQMIHIYRPDILKNTLPKIDPVETHEPVVSSIKYDFEDNNETGNPGWMKIKFINNNFLGTNNNVQITTISPYKGKKSLRTRMFGKAELTANLTGFKNANLSFFVKSTNPYTNIWVKPPGNQNWYRAKIPTKSKYIQYVFELPGPFNSIGDSHYQFRFGTHGLSTVYSYFDEIIIMNSTLAKQITNNICKLKLNKISF